MVTQIRGDAPGPAIARASTPFWSRDRQRILIPRGARFVGRVQAVQGLNQSRLSVTFDRLIFDNYNIRMPFAGLSQAGEAGLQDKVKRHYLATFGAAGAVGVISGLTLRNTQTTGFNVPAGQAARMEAGRSLGESTSAIMNRYLNRLPTIIIRAGHRIRIYSFPICSYPGGPHETRKSSTFSPFPRIPARSRKKAALRSRRSGRTPTHRTPSTPLAGAEA